MTRKKVIIVFLIFLGIVAVLGRYYYLNNTLGINNEFEKIVYDIGEEVEFGNNMCFGAEVYNGYSIKIDNVEIYDFEEYLTRYSVEKEKLKSIIPERVAEVTITLYNRECDNDNGISFSGFFLVGVDWYSTINEEFIRCSNPFFEDAETARGIIIPKNQEYTLKLVYSLSKEKFTTYNWKNINNEDMWIELTIDPQNKYIKIQ